LIDDNAYKSELRNITKNAGITAAGLVLFNIMSFVNNAIITRWLGAEQYGLYVLATRILEFLFVVAALGLNQSLIRFVSMYREAGSRSLVKGTINYSLKISIVASFVLMIPVFVLSDDIAIRIFERPALAIYLRLLLITIPFAVILAIFANTFVGLKMIKQQAVIINILPPMFFFLLILVAYFAGYGLDGLMAAHIVNVMIVAGVAVAMIRYYFYKPEKAVQPLLERRKLWDFNLPVYATQFSATAFRLSPIFILGLYLDNTQIGIYNVSYKIGTLVVFSMAMFRMIFMPTISGLFAKNDKATIRRLFQTVTRWIFAFSLAVSLLIQANGIVILGVFGPEFKTGLTVLSIMLLGELINASTGLTGAVIMMSGRSKLALANSVLQFGLILLLGFILIPHFGAVGAAIAYAAAMLLINLLILVELNYYEQLSPFNINFLKPLVAGVVAYPLIYFAGQMLALQPIWDLLMKTVLFLAAFTGIIVLLQPDADDKYLFGVIFRRFNIRFFNASKK
jgi:O-antigen/teichoic acid export membrane protein